MSLFDAVQAGSEVDPGLWFEPTPTLLAPSIGRAAWRVDAMRSLPATLTAATFDVSLQAVTPSAIASPFVVPAGPDDCIFHLLSVLGFPVVPVYRDNSAVEFTGTGTLGFRFTLDASGAAWESAALHLYAESLIGVPAGATLFVFVVPELDAAPYSASAVPGERGEIPFVCGSYDTTGITVPSTLVIPLDLDVLRPFVLGGHVALSLSSSSSSPSEMVGIRMRDAGAGPYPALVVTGSPGPPGPVSGVFHVEHLAPEPMPPFGPGNLPSAQAALQAVSTSVEVPQAPDSVRVRLALDPRFLHQDLEDGLATFALRGRWDGPAGSLIQAIAPGGLDPLLSPKLELIYSEEVGLVASNKTEIVNLALMHLGHHAIGSFDEAGKPAQLARGSYETHRDTVLRMYTWPFATRTQQIGATGVAPLDDRYLNVYLIPADTLRILEVHGASNQDGSGLPPWKRVGNEIWTDVPAPLTLSTIYRITNVALYPDDFVQALSYYLAMMWVEPLVKAASLKEVMFNALTQVLKAARGVSQQEEGPGIEEAYSIIGMR